MPARTPTRAPVATWVRDPEYPGIWNLREGGKSLGAIRHAGPGNWDAAVNEVRRGRYGWEGTIFGRFPTKGAAMRAVELLVAAGRAAVGR